MQTGEKVSRRQRAKGKEQRAEGTGQMAESKGQKTASRRWHREDKCSHHLLAYVTECNEYNVCVKYNVMNEMNVMKDTYAL